MNALVQRTDRLDTTAQPAKAAGRCIATGSTARPDRTTIMASLLSHPAFSDARKAIISNLTLLFRGDYLLSRLLLEEGRYLTIQTLLHLAAGQQAEERATWLTLGRLQSRLAGSELASRNRIEALVAILERYSFLERRKAEEDLRVTLLLPTPRLWGSDAVLAEAMAQPLAMFRDLRDPGPALCSLMARNRISGSAFAGPHDTGPGFDPQAPAWSNRDLATAGAGHRAWHRALSPHIDTYFALRAAHPQVQGLAARDGGYLTFLLLLGEVEQTGSARLCLPFETLSSHTGVSRTHARLLMELAEASGLIKLHARGGRDIEVLPALHQAADAWFADHMAFFLTLD